MDWRKRRDREREGVKERQRGREGVLGLGTSRN